MKYIKIYKNFSLIDLKINIRHIKIPMIKLDKASSTYKMIFKTVSKILEYEPNRFHARYTYEEKNFKLLNLGKKFISIA